MAGWESSIIFIHYSEQVERNKKEMIKIGEKHSEPFIGRIDFCIFLLFLHIISDANKPRGWCNTWYAYKGQNQCLVLFTNCLNIIFLFFLFDILLLAYVHICNTETKEGYDRPPAVKKSDFTLQYLLWSLFFFIYFINI